jgi:hypothetical protein
MNAKNEEAGSPVVFACPPPARNSFSHRDAEPAEVGIPFVTALLGELGISA